MRIFDGPKRRRIFSILMLVCFTISADVKAVSFEGLGDLAGGVFYSYALDISADGSVVVGASISGTTTEGVRWDNGVMTSLSVGSWSPASAVSADGSVIVGVGNVGSEVGGYSWTQGGGFDFLGDIQSQILGISADGSVMVGDTYEDSTFVSRRWQGSSASQPSPGESAALATSADGSVVVGVDGTIVGGVTQGGGFRWTASGGVTNPYPAAAHGISDDGSVVVGEGFYWTESGGIEALTGTAYGVSADGLVAVGKSDSGSAFFWGQSQGMLDIKSILENNGLDLTGWTLERANAIANDGLTIVGYGTNPDGYTEGWIATVPEPATILLLSLGAVFIRRLKR